MITVNFGEKFGGSKTFSDTNEIVEYAHQQAGMWSKNFEISSLSADTQSTNPIFLAPHNHWMLLSDLINEGTASSKSDEELQSKIISQINKYPVIIFQSNIGQSLINIHKNFGEESATGALKMLFEDSDSRIFSSMKKSEFWGALNIWSVLVGHDRKYVDQQIFFVTQQLFNAKKISNASKITSQFNRKS